MTIFIGADHRGFELKNQLIEYLQEKNVRVEDMGAYEHDIHDDYPDMASRVAQAVNQNPEGFLGIVICGSGVGVSIAANRTKGIRCGLGFDKKQIEDARAHDHINVLGLPSDFVSFDQAQQLVDAFLTTIPLQKEKYLRRIQKIDT